MEGAPPPVPTAGSLLMRSAVVLALEVGRASGPDMTRYLAVCAALIAALVALAWVFKRTLAGHLKARAAKRSLQVLDVLPLSGKQKLVVVRCYDRSFLLGLGEKEVRSIAELDLATDPQGTLAPVAPAPAATPRAAQPSFAATLDHELVVPPPPARAARAPVERPGGILA